MRGVRIAALAALLIGTASAASAIESCGEGRDLCEAVCTPAKVARYYAGVARRCTASCEPRWQQCLRTGVWVHLEDAQAGWHQPVTRW